MLFRPTHRYQPHAALWAAAAAASSGAKTLVAGETQALAFDFTDNFWQATTGFYASAYVLDTGTPANNYDSSPTQTQTSLLTYTSPSVKMLMGPSGLLRYPAHNLLLRSEDFTTTWSNDNTTDTANSTTAPDGASTADTITDNAVSGRHIVFQSATYVTGANYAFSVCLKAGTLGFAQVLLLLNGAGTVAYGVVVNLSTGAVTDTRSTGSPTNTSSSVTDLGSGWYRITVRGDAAGSSGNVVIGMSNSGTPAYTSESPSYSGSGSTIFAWGGQLYRTPADTAYIATTSAIRSILPLQWDSGGVLEGMRLEEARTNLCLYSSDLTNAAWTKSNMTTAKTATGPDGGTNTATTCTATAGNATALQAITSGSSARITSCWIKRRTGTGNIDLTQDNGSTWATVTVTSGWTRVNISSVTSTNPTVGIRIVTSGDAVDVALFQHETGANTSTPIETFGSTVTRAADNISMLTSAFPFSATNSSVYIKFVPQSTANVTYLWQVYKDANNRIQSYMASGNTIMSNVQAGSQDVSSTVAAVTAGSEYRLAISFKANDFAASQNGAAVVTDTSATLTTGYTALQFGTDNGTSIGNIIIKQFVVLPREWSDAELVTRST